jgi:hypothetical protein
MGIGRTVVCEYNLEPHPFSGDLDWLPGYKPDHVCNNAREARVGGWQGKPVTGLGPVTVSTEQRIKNWMNRLTADGTMTFSPEGTLAKMKEEWQEFLDTEAEDEFELADLIIAGIAYAHTRGWRIGLTIAEKMKINEARKWVQQPDGTIHHE